MRIGLIALASCFVAASGVLAVAAQPTDNYLIYNGKGSSTVIITTNGGLGVTPLDNYTTGCAGVISPVLTGKHMGELAFHGTINGAPDPAPNGIGWGLVLKSPKTGGILDQITLVSANVNDADDSLFKMGTACNENFMSEWQIGNAITGLGTVKTQVEFSIMNGYTPAKKGKSHLQEINDLITNLQSYKGDLVDSGIVTAATFDKFIAKLTKKKKKKKKIKKLLLALLLGLDQCNLLY